MSKNLNVYSKKFFKLNGLLIGERRNVEDLEKVLFKPTAERGHYEYLFENFKVNFFLNYKLNLAKILK